MVFRYLETWLKLTRTKIVNELKRTEVVWSSHGRDIGTHTMSVEYLYPFVLWSFMFAPFSGKVPKPLEARWLPTAPTLHPSSAKSSKKSSPSLTLSSALNKSSDSSLIGLNLVTFPNMNQSFWPGNWLYSLYWVTWPVWRQSWSWHHPKAHKMDS